MTLPSKHRPLRRKMPPRLKQMDLPKMVEDGFLQEGDYLFVSQYKNDTLRAFIKGNGISVETPDGPTEALSIHKAVQLSMNTDTPRNGWEYWRVGGNALDREYELFGCDIGLMPMREIRKAAVAQQWLEQASPRWPEKTHWELHRYVYDWLWNQTTDDWRNPPNEIWASQFDDVEIALAVVTDFIAYLYEDY